MISYASMTQGARNLAMLAALRMARPCVTGAQYARRAGLSVRARQWGMGVLPAGTSVRVYESSTTWAQADAC